MQDLTAAVPASILIVLGLLSLGSAVHGLMITDPPQGQLGILAGLAGYLLAWLVAFKICSR